MRAFALAGKGVVAVEFALVIFPLIFTLLAILKSGLDLYLRSALDNASQEIARQIYTGAVQNMTINGGPITQQAFINNIVCPKLPSVLQCSNVIVNLVDFTEASPTPYYNYVNAQSNGLVQPPLDNTQTSFCLGSTSSYMILQILYPMPLISSVFSSGGVATYQGQRVRVLFSTAAFRNEPFPTPTYVGC